MKLRLYRFVLKMIVKDRDKVFDEIAKLEREIVSQLKSDNKYSQSSFSENLLH